MFKHLHMQLMFQNEIIQNEVSLGKSPIIAPFAWGSIMELYN